MCDLAIVKSGAATDKVATAGATLGPALAVCRPPAGMVLVYAPALAASTSTRTKQLPFAGIAPPAKLSLGAGRLTMLGVAPQLDDTLGDGAKLKPAGKSSTKLTIGNDTVLVFVRLIVSCEACPFNTLLGENALATVGLAKIATPLVPVLLTGVLSPPPDTVALFVPVSGAFAATLTVSVIGG